MDTSTEPDNSTGTRGIWRPSHAYIMAVICLAIGCAIGFFLRGSAPAESSKTVTVVATPPVTPAAAPAAGVGSNNPAPASKMPTLEDLKRMGDKQAQPLLTELQKKPNDAALLNQTALTYKAAHQFDKAAEYFKKSLEKDPKNVAVRADLASCLYYLGDVDGALLQLNKSLSYDPKNAGTLLNIGIIEWKGKGDSAAAVASWQKLLQLNPEYPQKDRVEHLIEAAKQNKPQVAEKQ